VRRFARGPGARFAPAGPSRLDDLCRLRRGLAPDEYAALRRLTGGLRHLPFGADADALEHALLAARGDSDVELLAKCERLLGVDGADRDRPVADRDAAGDADAPGVAPARERVARLAFRFDEGSGELAAYLGSLRRNGFRAVSVAAGGAVTVFVEIAGESDLEVVQAMGLARSLRDIVRGARTHALRGRRVGH
jgi:hypothetical protein